MKKKLSTYNPRHIGKESSTAIALHNNLPLDLPRRAHAVKILNCHSLADLWGGVDLPI